MRGEHRGLIQAGYWTAVLIWPVGLIVGGILTAKGETLHGVWVMVIAVIVGAISLAAFG